MLAALAAAGGQAAAQVGLGGLAIGSGASASAYELTFWQSVAASEDQAQLEAYLAAYPNGAFSNLARLKIAALRQRQASPVPVPVAPPPAPAPSPAPAPPPVPAPAAPSEVQAGPPAPAPAAPSLAEQLQRLASGQAAASPANPPVPPGVAVPLAPALAPLPELRLPDHFCSAQARNLFYDAEYKPAMELADRNNQAAIAHLQALQRLYDERGRAGDIAGQNLLAAAARDYDPVAADAFKARSAYDAVFARMLAVPIRACAAGES